MSKVEYLEPQYLAGLFDGEGSIGVYCSGNSAGCSLRTQLAQNRSRAVSPVYDYLKSVYGGSIGEQRTKTGRIKLNWQLNGETAVRFLADILPWLRFKKDQAVIALTWQFARPKPARNPNGTFASCGSDHDQAIIRMLKEMKREE